MTTPTLPVDPTPFWAAEEVVAPELVALKALYDQARHVGTPHRSGTGPRALLAYAALPAMETLPALRDLALVEVGHEPGRYVYLAIGEGYRKTAAVGGGPGLAPGPDGVTLETRPVMLQHFGLTEKERRPFHIKITRWDGPKILQYDRLILPLDDGGSGHKDGAGEITHLLVGEVFLRVAKPG